MLEELNWEEVYKVWKYEAYSASTDLTSPIK